MLVALHVFASYGVGQGASLCSNRDFASDLIACRLQELMEWERVYARASF